MANSESDGFEDSVEIEISLEEINGLIMPDDYTGPRVLTSPSVYVNGEHNQETESKENGHTEKLTEAVLPSNSAGITHNVKKDEKVGLKSRNRKNPKFWAQRRRELKKKREAQLLADSEDEKTTEKTPKRKIAIKRAGLKATSTGWQVTKINEEELSESFSEMSLD